MAIIDRPGIAWVTGASKGIGRATALALARRGWTVAASARNEEELAEVVRAAPPNGRIVAFPLDITDAAGIASSVAAIGTQLGPIDLGTLGGLGSRALDINESLEVAGTSHTGAESGGFWIEHAFRWSSGAMTALAPLAGFSTSWGTAINDDGVVVGHSIQRVSGSAWTWRATMWVENEPVDLNTLIAPGSGAVIERAEGINNHGWIVGQARVGGQLRPILLRPLP